MGFKGRSGEGVFTLAFVLPPMAWGRILCRERFCLKIHNSQLVPIFWLVPNTTECVITKNTSLSIYSFCTYCQHFTKMHLKKLKQKGSKSSIAYLEISVTSSFIWYPNHLNSFRLVSRTNDDPLKVWHGCTRGMALTLNLLSAEPTKPPPVGDQERERDFSSWSERNNHVRCFSLAVIHLQKAQ